MADSNRPPCNSRLAGQSSVVTDRMGLRRVTARKVCLVVGAWMLACAGGGHTQAAEPAAPSGVSSRAGQQPDNRIVAERINKDFCQHGGSCVLSSYAIVANYFTGRPIGEYFEGYCQHFRLSYSDALDAEQKYAAHFDQEWRKRNCRGYEVILDLHSNSTVKCFAEARQRFDGHFYLDSAAHAQELEKLLKAQQAFLNITYEPGFDYHSITVVHDATGLLARDTNRKGLYPIPGLAKIGKLRDSVLYVGKQ